MIIDISRVLPSCLSPSLSLRPTCKLHIAYKFKVYIGLKCIPNIFMHAITIMNGKNIKPTRRDFIAIAHLLSLARANFIQIKLRHKNLSIYSIQLPIFHRKLFLSLSLFQFSFQFVFQNIFCVEFRFIAAF